MALPPIQLPIIPVASMIQHMLERSFVVWQSKTVYKMELRNQNGCYASLGLQTQSADQGKGVLAEIRAYSEPLFHRAG